MLTRTWPYGTELNGIVASVERRMTLKAAGRKPTTLVAVVTDDGEGHILVGADNAIEPAVHMRVVIQFTKGGPLGGYWRIVRQIEQEVAK
jgi:hypothetical protein